MHESPASFERRQESAERPVLLNEVQPSFFEKNTKEWIDLFQKRLELHVLEKEQRLERARQVVAALVPHHSTTFSHFKKAHETGFLYSAAHLEQTEEGAGLVRNTYEFDKKHGLDQFVFLRLGGVPFQQHRGKETLSLKFAPDILNEPDVLVSFQDIVFALEAEQYTPGIVAWDMYLKETFKGAEYTQVLAHLVASEDSDPASFVQSPRFSRQDPGIPGVAFTTSKEIQSEIKVPHAVSIQKVQHIEIPSSALHLVPSLQEMGYEDSHISVR